MNDPVTIGQGLAAAWAVAAVIVAVIGVSHRNLAGRLDRHRHHQSEISRDVSSMGKQVAALADHQAQQNGRLGRAEDDLRKLQVDLHAEVQALARATRESAQATSKALQRLEEMRQERRTGTD